MTDAAAWKIGDRVRVQIANPDGWTAVAVSVLNGRKGTVSEIVPNYSYPVVLGGRVPKAGFFVKLDDAERLTHLTDRGCSLTSGAWFDAEDLRDDGKEG